VAEDRYFQRNMIAIGRQPLSRAAASFVARLRASIGGVGAIRRNNGVPVQL
jgi:hypothetical protein